MSKHLITIAAVALMTASGAIAQTTKTPVPSATPADPAPTASVTAPRSTLIDIRSSKLVGAKVVNGGKTVGDINELMLDSSGKIQTVIVGVGGFLGIGEKNVSLKYEDLTISRDSKNNLVVTTGLDAAALSAMPAWNDPDKTPTR